MVQAGSVVGFGAFGLAVVAERVEAGEAVVEVESEGGQVVSCGVCGVRARSKGRRRVVLCGAPAAGGMPVGVLWNKRVWACPDRGCGARAWTERSGLAGARRVLTERAVGHAVGALGVSGASVAGLARGLGVGWHTVWSAALPALRQAAEDPDRVVPAARVGFDETVMASATRRRRRRFVSAAVDADTGQILDVFDGRDAPGLERWAKQQPKGRMAAVESVCSDPHEGYRKAIRSLKAEDVPGEQARVAADPFPHRRFGEPGARRLPPQNPKRHPGTPRPQRRPALRRPQDAPHRRRAARSPRVGADAQSTRPRRPLRRGRRLLGGRREDPLGVQHRRPRPGLRPARRRHRPLPRTRSSPRAAQTRPNPQPVATRDQNQHLNRRPQRQNRSSQRQNQRHQTHRPGLHRPRQLPAPNPICSRTTTRPNPTSHKNQNPTSQLGSVEPDDERV